MRTILILASVVAVGCVAPVASTTCETGTEASEACGDPTTPTGDTGTGWWTAPPVEILDLVAECADDVVTVRAEVSRSAGGGQLAIVLDGVVELHPLERVGEFAWGVTLGTGEYLPGESTALDCQGFDLAGIAVAIGDGCALDGADGTGLPPSFYGCVVIAP